MEDMLYDKYFVFACRVEEIIKDKSLRDKEKIKQIEFWHELIKNIKNW